MSIRYLMIIEFDPGTECWSAHIRGDGLHEKATGATIVGAVANWITKYEHVRIYNDKSLDQEFSYGKWRRKK